MALEELFPIAARHGEGRRQAAWLFLLIAAGFVSSFTFACVTPFSAFALLSAATLTLPRALGVMAAIWLVNQIIGYLALGYPLDGLSMTWGATIGIAALAGTAVAAAIVAVARAWPLWSRLAAGFVAAIVAYEAVLFLAALVLGGSGNFAPGIVAKVALSDTGWLIGLAILRHGMLRFGLLRREGPRPVTT
jgi:hypothetical protein